jgi:hypothetical protein
MNTKLVVVSSNGENNSNSINYDRLITRDLILTDLAQKVLS